MHEIIGITAVVRPFYTCKDCGAQAQGGTRTIEALALSNLRAALDEPVRPHWMPVGWASYSGPSYRCPRCAK